MPYKSVEARRRKQAERRRKLQEDSEWQARESARKESFRHQHVHEIRDYHNERNFRFRHWEASRTMSKVYEELSIYFTGTQLQVENPRFVFIYGGKRQYTETLFDPLPKF